MAERSDYARVRQEIINALRMDLLGPSAEDEILKENPRNAYILGMLAPSGDESSKDEYNEQELESDIAYEDGADFSVQGEEDDNEPITTTTFIPPSSIGISFYLGKSARDFNIEVSWGDYFKKTEKNVKEDKKTHEQRETEKISYCRVSRKEIINVDLNSFLRSREYALSNDSNIKLHVTRFITKKGYSLISVYLMNKRKNSAGFLESLMFQVEIKALSVDGSKIFYSEDICREVLARDEFYFKQRPIFGRGRGCAVVWGEVENGKSSYVKSEFVPEYELPGVSASLEGFDKFFFSMRLLSISKKKEEILGKLETLAGSYEKWINSELVASNYMKDSTFREEIGNDVIFKCKDALERIREGIALINTNSTVFDAFCFMNRCMLLQRNIMNFSKKYGAGIECSFRDFTDPYDDNNDFGWRPFQIAFILMNLSGMVNPLHKDRQVVDLLYFPTGGGKTEAYLGLMAFVIAFRRLNTSTDDGFNHDGGVTAILRYTLRLLTTQQRDRITKMVVAAEMIRKREFPKYGKESISIGFWVGGGVTPNKFSDLIVNTDNNEETVRHNKNMLFKQLLECPFCGKPLSEESFEIDTDKQSVSVFCSDEHCMFYKYNSPEKRMQIPVYLVDEEIYARCPTIILSTVDKFARLPWDPKTNAIFGRVDRLCERHGYVAIGEEHKRHNKTATLPAAGIKEIKPFLPPELIIQDELHLISGPLGTVYGAYETIIENLCSYSIGGKTLKPKYVVSTATIKNAAEQTKCLYARTKTTQFPPNGFEIGDSFFIREVPVSINPFRKYVGICAPGQSVKTTLLRVYAIVLQKGCDLLGDNDSSLVDPYYTLVGYFNSIRELGGMVRLLQDDIPKRIHRLQKRYESAKERYLSRRVEITSRMPSYQIPNKLKQLETTVSERACLDTAIATNMIAVGMDVDRLGLMVVTGQPKQNSEYIQATSRIGRNYPGVVFTVYNPYRPRDLSHYENFTGYHSQLYRFVEGTTATPFSARARDKVLHALLISAIRLKYPQFANNDGASLIENLDNKQLHDIKNLIIERLNIIKPSAKQDAEQEIDQFVESWKKLAKDCEKEKKPLKYYVYKTDKYSRLMNFYSEQCSKEEKGTLNAMREVENAANMYYYEEE